MASLVRDQSKTDADFLRPRFIYGISRDPMAPDADAAKSRQGVQSSWGFLCRVWGTEIKVIYHVITQESFSTNEDIFKEKLGV